MENQFRQRLYDIEATPPADAWDGIAAELARRRRRRFLAWMCICGVALSVCALLWISRDQKRPPFDPQADRPNAAAHLSTDATAIGESGAPEATSSHTAVHTSPPSAQAIAADNATERSLRTVKSAALPPPPATETADLALPQMRPAQIGEAPNPPETTLAPDLYAARVSILSRLPLRQSAALPSQERPLPSPSACARAATKPNKSKTGRYCYDFERKPTAWMIDLYGGPAIGRTVYRTADPEYDAYARRRQNTEEDIVGFSAGLRLSRVFNRFLTLRAGLDYEHLTQRFVFVDKRYKRETYTTNTQLVNGQWVTVTDTLVEFGISSQTIYNRYRRLDIPLMIGMEMRSGRSGLSVQAGASFNLAFVPSGAILSPSNQKMSLNANARQLFKVNAGLSAATSAQCFFYINPNLRAFAELAYRQPLAPVTQPIYPVQQWQGSVALRLGGTWLFE